VLPVEDAGEFVALEAALTLELAPADTLQTILVGRIARAAWRLERAEQLEVELFERRHVAEVGVGLALIRDGNGTRSVETVLRYRGAAQAELTRALRTLKALQAEQKAPAPAGRRVRPEPTTPTLPPRIPARGAPGRPASRRNPNEPAARRNPDEPAPSSHPKEPEQPNVIEGSIREFSAAPAGHVRSEGQCGKPPAPGQPLVDLDPLAFLACQGGNPSQRVSQGIGSRSGAGAAAATDAGPAASGPMDQGGAA
jgi:hypothetical protein